MSSRRLAWSAMVALSTLLAFSVVAGCWGFGTSGGTAVSGGSAGPSGPTSSGGTAAVEGTVDLAATGQTTSSALGDDGEHQAGVAIDSASRFTDNGDGTITDTLTGLMWLQDGLCMIHQYEEWEFDGWANGLVPWEHGLQFIAQVNDGTLRRCGAGHSDWRMPNVVELESLINVGQTAPNEWLMTTGFVSIEACDYWTSTTYHASPEVFAYVVNMATGDVSGMGNKSLSPVAVLPVRGTTDGNTTELWKTGQTTSYADADDGDLQVGVAWPDPRFTDNGDGTITDNLTGLMWVQDATCLGLVTWQEALIAADRFNDNSALFECENYTAAYTDWRLPNRKEMFSLPDFSQDHPALQTGHPFQQVNINTSYWTSTANAANEERAWWCDLRTGEVGHDYKVNARRMMPVR